MTALRPQITSDERRELIWLAWSLAGRRRSVNLVTLVLDEDHEAVADVLSECHPSIETPEHSAEADRVRQQIVAVLLERWWDDLDLLEISDHLEAMIDAPAELWSRLGDAAAQSHDHEIAAAAFARAASILADGSTDPHELFELVLRASTEAQLVGDLARAHRHTRWALKLAERLDAPDALARVLAQWWDPGFAIDESRLELFERAWCRLGSATSVLATQLLCAQVYTTYLNDPDLSNDLASKAEAMAQQLDDPDATVAALEARRMALCGTVPLDQAELVGARLVAIGRENNNRMALAKGHETLIITALLAGDTEELDLRLAAYRMNATQTDSARWSLYADQIDALQHLCRGELDAAERMVTDSLTRAGAHGDVLGVQVALAQRAMISIERDEADVALTIAAAQTSTNPLLRMWRLGALFAATRLGNEPAVEGFLDQLVPEPEWTARWRYQWLGELVVLGDAVALVGDADRADVLYDELAPHGHRCAAMATAVGLGSIWRTLASLSVALGEHDRADREFDAAELANRRLGAHPWLCRGWLDHARSLMARDRVVEAQAYVEQCHKTAVRLGLHRLQRDAEATAALLAAAAPRNSPIDGLTERESDLMSGVARGQSNRDLAEQLFISVKTVERHLSNIYTKLGVRGRADAVAWAFEHGLQLDVSPDGPSGT